MFDRPVLYLIDGHAVAYRQFFAMPLGAFTTSDGEPTNATYGFTRVLLDVLQHERPKYLAVSFDMGLSGRDALYEEYKSTREKMPDELDVQIGRIREVVQTFNIPVMALEGYEADDVIGTITRQALEQDLAVHIVTGDRDILQLLEPHVRVQLPKRGQDDIVYTLDDFPALYAVEDKKTGDSISLEAHQLIDLKGLMGDSSDNIPGIKGIGEKTGIKLLAEYGTLEGIYDHIDEIKGAVKKKLIEGRDIAFLSRDLATIQRDLPVTLDIKACVAQDYDAEAVGDLFRVLEFRSLFDRLQNHDLRQLPMFAQEGASLDKPAPPPIVKTTIVNDKDKLDALVAALNAADAIVWDVETTGIDQMAARLVGIALAVDGDSGYYIPVAHDKGQQIDLAFVLDALRGPMTNPDIPKYAHNATYDLVMLQRYGLTVQPVAFDTMVAEWVRDPISKFLGLKNFARQYLNETMVDIEELIGSGKDQKTMNEVPIEHVAPYAAADAAMTMRAVIFLRDHMEAQALKLVDELEMPLIPVIAAMEQAGVMLDTAYLAEMSQRLDGQLRDLEQTIYGLSGGYGAFNINSPKQLNEVLFDTLNLPREGLKKTSHGFSTDITTMEALKGEHDIIPYIIEYRELSKLKGTYVDALPELVNPQTGRVHTSYNQTGTSTGRFSSSNPNLQNIPIRTELGREVRRAFIAPEGTVLLAVDYSQIELRVMAHISQDATLLEAFRQGQDIHKATAAAVFGVEPAAVTYEQRSFAKRVNFGLMYGMGEYRLARDSDLTLAESRKFIKTYFDRLPNVERYIEETKQFAIDNGYVETLMGRRRYFPALKGNTSGQRGQAELRAAINMPIQGTAADILKLAMIRLYDELQQRPTQARMILQVHDELVLEVPQDELHDIAALVVDTMQSAYELAIPLVANAEYGTNWLDMQSLNEHLV